MLAAPNTRIQIPSCRYQRLQFSQLFHCLLVFPMRAKYHISYSLKYSSGIQFYPRDRLGIHCRGGWMGHRDQSGRARKISRPRRFDVRPVRPVAIRQSDCAVPITVLKETKGKKVCPRFWSSLLRMSTLLVRRSLQNRRKTPFVQAASL